MHKAKQHQRGATDGYKRNVLGVLVDAVDPETAARMILHAAERREPFGATALAVHGLMTGVRDSHHRYRINHLDGVLPDGQPVRWALNLLHRTGLRERVYGPNLMLDVLALASERGLPVFLYGSTERVLTRLAGRLRDRFPRLQLAGWLPSLFRTTTEREREHIVRSIRCSGAALVLVGLGCPRQEIWVYEYRRLLSMPLIAVGAAFAFHSGDLAQAPRMLQRFGLEWAFRLVMEPRRLWRRYLLLNPAFVGLLAMQWTGFRRFDSSQCEPPSCDLLVG